MGNRVKMSCILPTANRPLWLAKAVDLYRDQSMRLAGHTQLIIVESVPELLQGMIGVYGGDDITHCMTTESNLGEKMNIGIRLSKGNVIQKLDDDDYYSTDFLNVSYASIVEHGVEFLSGSSAYLSVIQHNPDIHLLTNWFASGTLAFHRAVWDRAPFPRAAKAVGKHFMMAHPELIRCYLNDPELYLFTRHTHSTWKMYHGDHGLSTVEEEILKCPHYTKPLEAFMPPKHTPFYKSLMQAKVNVTI